MVGILNLDKGSGFLETSDHSYSGVCFIHLVNFTILSHIFDSRSGFQNQDYQLNISGWG